MNIELPVQEYVMFELCAVICFLTGGVGEMAAEIYRELV